jgi:hypothetical protein
MSAHDESPSIRDEEEATHTAEDLKDLITEKDLLRTQLMSSIRIIESDITKNKLLAELQDDLFVCEKDLHELKVCIYLFIFWIFLL